MSITVEELKVILRANTDEYTRKLQQAQGQTRGFANNVKQAGGATQGANNAISGAIRPLVAYGAAFFAAGKIIGDVSRTLTSSADAFLEFERGATGIVRSMDMTRDQALELSKALYQIETPTSIYELQEIARVAGQMGIAKENTVEFARAIDMIGVALGDDLTGDIGQITGQLAKIANVFQMVDKEGRVTAEAITQIGSGINELGKTGVATAPFLVDFSQRVGATANIFKLTLGQVMGLGAAFEELGLSSEVSATAINTIFARMGKDIEAFASVAGVSAAEFRDMFERDTLGAFMKFSEGVVKGQGNLEGITLALEEAGISGGRIIQVLGALGGNVDSVGRRIGIATDAIAENISIQKEFEESTSTVGAEQEKLQKQLDETRIANGETVAELQNEWLKFQIELEKNIIPGITGALGEFLSFVNESRDAVKGLLRPVEEFANSAGDIKKEWEAAGGTVEEFEKLAKSAVAGTSDLSEASIKLFETAKEGIANLRVEALANSMSTLGVSIGQVERAMSAAGVTAESLNDDMVNMLVESVKGAGTADEAMSKLGEGLKGLSTQNVPELRQTIEGLSNAGQDALLNNEKFAKQMADQYGITTSAVKNMIKEVNGEINNSNNTAHNFLQTLQRISQQGIKGLMAGATKGLPAFAEGGIVGGSSYSGDHVLARVNSGEMILNKQQQTKLFDMLQAGSASTTNNDMKVEQNFYNTNIDPAAVVSYLFHRTKRT